MAAGGLASRGDVDCCAALDGLLCEDAILAVRPGVRRAGRSTAEPGADAGPAAPQAPRLFKYGSIRQCSGQADWRITTGPQIVLR
jgi:hypothetical protein